MRIALGAFSIIVAMAVLIILISPGFADEPEYICGMKEHTHTDACYLELVCELDEGHDHDEGCYEAPLLCTMPTDHEHSYSCYYEPVICGYEEGEEIGEGEVHNHISSCYGLELVCGIEENHVHNETCYGEPVLVCTETGHFHNKDCYIMSDELQCGLIEHVHDESCLPVEEELAFEPEGESVCQLCMDNAPHGHAGGTEPTTAAKQAAAPGFMGIAAISGGDGFDSELKNFLRSAVITNSDGTDPGGVYTVGADYIISLKFEEAPTTLQFEHNTSGYMTYQLPEEIKIITPVDKGKIMAKEMILVGGVLTPTSKDIEVGEFSVDEDGAVTVKFYNVDEAGLPASKPYFDHFSNCYFDLDLYAQFASSGGSQSIDFGNSVTIDVDVDEKAAALSLTKEADYDKAAETIDYTVTIKAEEGPLDHITFTDIFKSSDVSGGGFGAAARPGDRGFLQNLMVSINGGAETPYSEDTSELPGTYSWDSLGNLKVHFDPDITLETGEEIVVTYRMDVGYLLEEGIVTKSNSPYGNSTGRRYAYNLNMQNEVTVTAMDSEEGVLNSTAKTATQASRSDLYKTGEMSSDGKTIRYDVRAGADYQVILNGMNITDTLGDGLTFGSGTTVTVYYYDDLNNEISPSPLKTFTASGKSFTHTVPSGFNGKDIYRVRFVYDAIIENPTSATPSTFDNTITIHNYLDVGDQSETIKTTNPSANMAVSKAGTIIGDSIEWTITWFIPGIYAGQPIYFMDYFSDEVYNRPDPESVSIMVDNGTTTELLETDKYDVVYGSDSGSQRQRWYIYFKEYTLGTTAAPATGSISPFGSTSVTLTITYRTDIREAKFYNGTNNGKTLKEFWEDAARAHSSALNDAICNHVEVAGSLDGGKTWTPVNRFVYIYYPLNKIATINNGEIWYLVTIDRTENAALSRYQDWGSNPIFEDTFNSDLMEYVEGSFRVQYYSGSFPGGIQSYGAYNSSGVDQLSTYISDNGGTSTISVHLSALNKIRGPVYGDNYAEWVGPPTLTWTVSGSPLAVAPETATSPVSSTSEKWWDPSQAGGRPMGQPLYIYYRMRLKDIDPKMVDPEEPLKIDNTATLKGENGSYSANETTDYRVYIVDKEMKKDAEAGNRADVTIDINPMGLKLAQDNKDPEGLIDVVDIMSDTLSAYLGSISIHAKYPAGTLTYEEMEINQEDGEIWSYKVEGNKITFKVPDETPLKITYSALIKGNPGQIIAITNEVSVYGKYEAKVIQSFDVSSAQGSAGGAYVPVTLRKTDADGGAYLPGAKFALYASEDFPARPKKDDANGSEHYKVADKYKVAEEDFYFLQYGVTDSSGQILFSNEFLTLNSHAIYAIVEIEQPDGYVMPTDPVKLFSFEELDASAYLPRTVKVISDYVEVENTKESASVTIGGKKTVESATGAAPPEEEFTFNLTQVGVVNFGDVSTLTITGPTAGGIEGEKTTAGAGTFEFKIDGLAGGTYYFMVTEADDGADNWAYDKTQYLFEAAINYPGKLDPSTPDITVTYRTRAGEEELWGVITPGGAAGNPAKFVNTYDDEPYYMTINKSWDGGIVQDDERNKDIVFVLVGNGVVPQTYTSDYKGGGVFRIDFDIATFDTGLTYTLYEICPAEYEPVGDGWVLIGPESSPLGYNRFKLLYDLTIMDKGAGNAVTVTGKHNISKVSFDGANPPWAYVDNCHVGGPMLPETGGEGLGRFLLTGLALMTGAVIALTVRRKVARVRS